MNSFKGFEPDKAKQFVACNYDGYVIGDVIFFYLEKDLFNIVGRPSVHNWVQYHAETGHYDVQLERDERSVARPGPILRKAYRYQVQGPNAMKVIEKVDGQVRAGAEVLPHDHASRSLGHKVRALRHGMAGQPGWSCSDRGLTVEAVKRPLLRPDKNSDCDRSGREPTHPIRLNQDGFLHQCRRSILEKK